MNPEIKTMWLDALRSGNYEQGQDVLHNKTENTYCCLGVLCDLAAKAGVVTEGSVPIPNGLGSELAPNWAMYDKAIYYLPESVMKWAELESNPEIPQQTPGSGPKTIAGLNDRGQSFEQIAKVIEECL